jgi:YVTN family beta-propeller protein
MNFPRRWLVSRRFCSLISLLIVLILISTSAIAQRRVDDPDDEEDLNRELWEFARGTPYDSILAYVKEAQRVSRATQTAEVELPNGWRIKPAGTQVEVGRLPYEAVPFAGKLVVLNTGYYYLKNKEQHEVSIVNLATAQVEKTLKINSLFPSAVVGGDGDLYISGGFDQKVFRVDRDFNVTREYVVGGFTGGLASIDRDHLAVSYLAIKNDKGEYFNGKIAILNTVSGKIEREVPVGYFPYALRFVGGKLFMTLLGENKILVFDQGLRLLKTVVGGRVPQEMCTDGRTLYVVNTDSDDLSVIDVATNRVTKTISVAQPGSRFGVTPSSCAIDGNRLYVTLAGTNAIAVLNRATGKRLTQLPTGWYPAKVISTEKDILVLSAKGIRARHPNAENGPKPGASRVAGYVLNLLGGSLGIISKADLPSLSRQDPGAPIFDPQRGFSLPIRHVFYVIKENRTYDQVLGDLGRGNGDPKLTLFGDEISPIQHQLAREFVTLDNFFVNGEISVLGHAYTTSGYTSPFVQWLANLSYADRWKGYPFGPEPATMSPHHLWDELERKNVDYKIYGENYCLFTRAYRILTDQFGPDSQLAKKFYDKSVAAAAGEDRGQEFNDFAGPYADRARSKPDAYQLLADDTFRARLSRFLVGDESLAAAIKSNDKLRRAFADYLYHYPFSFRSWDLAVSDLDRLGEWKKDFEAQLKSGNVPALQYIWLPNDHTDGSNKKIHDPYEFIAQNDAALGRLIEIISHSPVWKDSLVLVVEDDAQNGADHVDATRTIAFAAGPYVKRGALVSDRYDQLSMLRTIEILLGLDPINLGDRMAAPMFGILTNKPDNTPFTVKKVSERIADVDRKRYRELGGSAN